MAIREVDEQARLGAGSAPVQIVVGGATTVLGSSMQLIILRSFCLHQRPCPTAKAQVSPAVTIDRSIASLKCTQSDPQKIGTCVGVCEGITSWTKTLRRAERPRR